MRDMINNLKLRPLNKLDWYILIVMCIATIGIASYDYYNLQETKQTCLTDCNNHWVKEFETKCMGIYGQEENIYSLIYNPNITTKTIEQRMIINGMPPPVFQTETEAIKTPLT